MGTSVVVYYAQDKGRREGTWKAYIGSTGRTEPYDQDSVGEVLSHGTVFLRSGSLMARYLIPLPAAQGASVCPIKK